MTLQLPLEAPIDDRRDNRSHNHQEAKHHQTYKCVNNPPQTAADQR
ncbi:hypothetical protein MPTK1_8g18840 [Marchantia polymorpha subsp. ruderalis]|nr:hypothetical protein Mp_8g18840 [Marchantia polymorpha subsp. ruderalis]